jgi:hypothetical protein
MIIRDLSTSGDAHIVQPKAISVNLEEASTVGISEARSTQVSSNQIGIEQDDSFEFSACQSGSEQIDPR